MRRHILILWILCILPTLAFGMPIAEPLPPAQHDLQGSLAFGSSVRQFSDKLFLDGLGQDANRMISPLSALLVLAMSANGAEGETQREMIEVLTEGHLDKDALNRESLFYLSRLPEEVSIANSLWVNQRLSLSQAFEREAKHYYQAEAAGLDFSKASSAKRINDWVSKATRNAIDSIIDATREDMVLYLINAISFKDDWKSPFEATATAKRTFHAKSGDVRAPFLNQTGFFPYASIDGASLLTLPYQNERYTMVLLLPDEETDITTYLEGWNDSRFSSFLLDQAKQSKHTRVRLSLPKFESTYKDSLVDNLSRLGMRECFNPMQADFSALLSPSSKEVVIDEVLHKTFIRVDEQGTEAAAVTAVMMRATSMAPQDELVLIFDRPFFYAILDLEAHIPLFLGVLDSPQLR
ncbi:MAG: serine proteinase inhibitor [Spirochaetia bacterium]|uniref:serpin family protein n=1 Tax=Sphaerochaeta sp. TaxID=1972642 RepID=UPI001D5E8656|nr:serine proteinase inhibitor [Spirochaetia bacterium]NCC90114.1 serine proteinase inhibitor [Spirochaetia bacterium]